MKSLALAASAIAASAAVVAGIDVASPAPRPAQPPRRLSVEKDHHWYDPIVSHVGVRFNGAERNNDVCCYDADEGWIAVYRRQANGQFLCDTFGNRLTLIMDGRVEPYWRQNGAPVRTFDQFVAPEPDHAANLARAAEKRARKAAKLAAQR